MKNKIIRILLVFFFITQFSAALVVKADYSVTLGAEFSYNVVESSWDYSMGTASSEGTGFRFEDQKFSNDKQISLTIDYIEIQYLEYTMTVDTESKTGLASPLVLAGIVFLLSYPQLFLSGIEYHIQTEADLGIKIRELFFLEPVNAEDSFNLFCDEESLSSEFQNDEYITYNNIYGTFDSSSDIAVFTWYYDISYVDEGDDYGSIFTFTLEYDQNTGVLKRYRFDLELDGTYDYKPIDLVRHQEIVAEDYTQEGSLFTATGLLATTTLSLLIVLYAKKRNKKY